MSDSIGDHAAAPNESQLLVEMSSTEVDSFRSDGEEEQHDVVESPDQQQQSQHSQMQSSSSAHTLADVAPRAASSIGLSRSESADAEMLPAATQQRSSTSRRPKSAYTAVPRKAAFRPTSARPVKNQQEEKELMQMRWEQMQTQQQEMKIEQNTAGVTEESAHSSPHQTSTVAPPPPPPRPVPSLDLREIFGSYEPDHRPIIGVGFEPGSVRSSARRSEYDAEQEEGREDDETVMSHGDDEGGDAAEHGFEHEEQQQSTDPSAFPNPSTTTTGSYRSHHSSMPHRAPRRRVDKRYDVDSSSDNHELSADATSALSFAPPPANIGSFLRTRAIRGTSAAKRAWSKLKEPVEMTKEQEKLYLQLGAEPSPRKRPNTAGSTRVKDSAMASTSSRPSSRPGTARSTIPTARPLSASTAIAGEFSFSSSLQRDDVDDDSTHDDPDTNNSTSSSFTYTQPIFYLSPTIGAPPPSIPFSSPLRAKNSGIVYHAGGGVGGGGAAGGASTLAGDGADWKRVEKRMKKEEMRQRREREEDDARKREERRQQQEHAKATELYDRWNIPVTPSTVASVTPASTSEQEGQQQTAGDAVAEDDDEPQLDILTGEARATEEGNDEDDGGFHVRDEDDDEEEDVGKEDAKEESDEEDQDDDVDMSSSSSSIRRPQSAHTTRPKSAHLHTSASRPQSSSLHHHTHKPSPPPTSAPHSRPPSHAHSHTRARTRPSSSNTTSAAAWKSYQDYTKLRSTAPVAKREVEEKSSSSTYSASSGTTTAAPIPVLVQENIFYPSNYIPYHPPAATASASADSNEALLNASRVFTSSSPTATVSPSISTSLPIGEQGTIRPLAALPAWQVPTEKRKRDEQMQEMRRKKQEILKLRVSHMTTAGNTTAIATSNGTTVTAAATTVLADSQSPPLPSPRTAALTERRRIIGMHYHTPSFRAKMRDNVPVQKELTEKSRKGEMKQQTVPPPHISYRTSGGAITSQSPLTSSKHGLSILAELQRRKEEGLRQSRRDSVETKMMRVRGLMTQQGSGNGGETKKEQAEEKTSSTTNSNLNDPTAPHDDSLHIVITRISSRGGTPLVRSRPQSASLRGGRGAASVVVEDEHGRQVSVSQAEGGSGGVGGVGNEEAKENSEAPTKAHPSPSVRVEDEISKYHPSSARSCIETSTTDKHFPRSTNASRLRQHMQSTSSALASRLLTLATERGLHASLPVRAEMAAFHDVGDHIRKVVRMANSSTGRGGATAKQGAGGGGGMRRKFKSSMSDDSSASWLQNAVGHIDFTSSSPPSTFLPPSTITSTSSHFHPVLVSPPGPNDRVTLDYELNQISSPRVYTHNAFRTKRGALVKVGENGGGEVRPSGGRPKSAIVGSMKKKQENTTEQAQAPIIDSAPSNPHNSYVGPPSVKTRPFSASSITSADSSSSASASSYPIRALRIVNFNSLPSTRERVYSALAHHPDEARLFTGLFTPHSMITASSPYEM